ncbi:hypothetical protein MPL1032_180239 [Mesorhizobium plurifarium]|uniref:Uncharacterized protein n=1 Tax=Mesorhizobium plurifarium TaxID=69974 RepID=A0A0K2VU17_MESPL|nr:hypothetical protein MPL1032_180239 [Mesorhizobium plurifarium]
MITQGPLLPERVLALPRVLVLLVQAPVRRRLLLRSPVPDQREAHSRRPASGCRP